MSNNPWHDLSIGDNYPETFNAIIEIPKGKRTKTELDKVSGLYKVDRILQGSFIYPANYGFLPRTLSGDGDPLDVLVLGQDSIPTGAYLEARAIGYVKMTDDGKPDDKIIAIHVNDPAVSMHTEASELKGYIITEIERFLSDYKKYENKVVVTGGIGSAREARELIEESRLAYLEYKKQDTNIPECTY